MIDPSEGRTLAAQHGGGDRKAASEISEGMDADGYAQKVQPAVQSLGHKSRRPPQILYRGALVP